MKSVFEELAAGDMRDPPHYALEVVHSSVRFRFKRPAKRVKNISPENNIYIYLPKLELSMRTKGTKWNKRTKSEPKCTKHVPHVSTSTSRISRLKFAKFKNMLRIQSTPSLVNTLRNWKRGPLVELSAYENYSHKKKGEEGKSKALWANSRTIEIDVWFPY